MRAVQTPSLNENNECRRFQIYIYAMSAPVPYFSCSYPSRTLWNQERNTDWKLRKFALTRLPRARPPPPLPWEDRTADSTKRQSLISFSLASLLSERSCVAFKLLSRYSWLGLLGLRLLLGSSVDVLISVHDRAMNPRSWESVCFVGHDAMESLLTVDLCVSLFIQLAWHQEQRLVLPRFRMLLWSCCKMASMYIAKFRFVTLQMGFRLLSRNLVSK